MGKGESALPHSGTGHLLTLLLFALQQLIEKGPEVFSKAGQFLSNNK